MLPWEEEQPPLLPWEEEKEQGQPPLQGQPALLPWEEEKEQGQPPDQGQPPLLPWEEEKEQGPPPLLQPGEHPGRLPPAQLHLDALDLPEERQAPAQQGSGLLHLALVQAWGHLVLRVQALAERAQHPNQKCQPKLRVSGVLAWDEHLATWQASHVQVAAASLVASPRCSRPALVAAWRTPQNHGRRLALLLHRRSRGEHPIEPPAQLLSWASHLSNKSVVRKVCALEVVGSEVDHGHSML